MDDGRYINNGWLQELPDPITKLTWDNAAIMSPVLAKHLGVNTGDLVQHCRHRKGPAMPEKKNIRRELVIAVLISPGHADNSITIPLGYGRKKTGPVGEEAGFNGYLLRNSSNPHFITADGKTVEKRRSHESGWDVRAFDHAGSLEHRRPRPRARSDGRALSQRPRIREEDRGGRTNCRTRICRRFTAIRRSRPRISGGCRSI